MLNLSGISIKTVNSNEGRSLYSISTEPLFPHSLRTDRAYLVKNSAPVPIGFKHYLTFDEDTSNLPQDAGYTVLSQEFGYLDNNDVISLTSTGRVRSLFREKSKHNAILLTEQCNNYCLMCSQPPRDIDDRWLLDQAKQLVKLIPRETASLGITGGEPTLFGSGFIDLLHLTKSWLPSTAIHVRSNG